MRHEKRLRVLLFALSLGVLALVLAVRLGQKGTTFWEPGWQTRSSWRLCRPARR